MSTGNQDSPLMYGLRPILGIDVCEHAYYLKYRDRREEYVATRRRLINWENVSNLYDLYVEQTEAGSRWDTTEAPRTPARPADSDLEDSRSVRI